MKESQREWVLESAAWAKRHLRMLVVPILAAAVPSVLVFSQTQIKDTVERFLTDCLFVVDKHVESDKLILVSGHLSGTPPKRLPLNFEGKDALVNSVFFDIPQGDGGAEPLELARHPQSGSLCPGELCDSTGNSVDRPTMPVTVADLHRDFVYRFKVRMTVPGDVPLRAEHLAIYGEYPRGLPDGMCRIQPRHWSNVWVWASPLQKFMLLCGLLVVAALLVRYSSKEN